MEDYKEKYEKALSRASYIKDYNTVATPQEVAELLFPELKESEDERIRKHLLKHFSNKTKEEWNGMPIKNIIAWLEKQGEQEHVVVVPRFRVGDVIRPKGSTAEYTIKSISGEYYHGKGWGLHISCDDDYELVEQKTADKVEPKFKVGDTIVEKDLDEYDYETIKDIKDRQYIFTDGYCMNIDEQEGWKLVKTPTIIEQKPAWSEEDEELLTDAIKYLEIFDAQGIHGNRAVPAINWLKSLKDRMKGE